MPRHDECCTGGRPLHVAPAGARCMLHRQVSVACCTDCPHPPGTAPYMLYMYMYIYIYIHIYIYVAPTAHTWHPPRRSVYFARSVLSQPRAKSAQIPRQIALQGRPPTDWPHDAHSLSALQRPLCHTMQGHEGWRCLFVRTVLQLSQPRISSELLIGRSLDLLLPSPSARESPRHGACPA